MEPSIPTSFIPKRPIDPGIPATAGKQPRRGWTSFLSFLIILALGGVVAGSYFYEVSLSGQVNSAKEALVSARDGIGTDFVSDMKRLDDRIASVKTLLDNHVVVTPIFQALQATTLRSVQYTDFTYALVNQDNVKTVQVTLLGTAKEYSTLALQSDAFLGSTLIKNPVFSNLEVDDTTHKLKFKLEFSVDAGALTYERFIASLAGTPAQQVPQVVQDGAATTNTTTQ